MGYRLYSTIEKVANPTSQIQFARLSGGISAKSHSLNSARNQVVFGEIPHSIKLGLGESFGKDIMPALTQSARELAAMIDHTLLKPEATRSEIEKLCAEGEEYGFASVCVQPFRVALAASLVRKTKICTVIGFPLGANRAEVKALETIRAVADGAHEIDMVMNLGAFKEGNFAAVENDISSVVKAAKGSLVKVILETCYLSPDEIASACAISEIAGADFVKTSTGFAKGGATVEAIQAMHGAVGGRLGIKASGGIRDLKTAQALIAAGATRLGTSQSVALVSGEELSKDKY